jgi:hypothetical protein
MTTTITPDHLQASLAQVAKLGQLTAAWEDVLASDDDDGILGPGVARFARDAQENLAEMAAQLPAGAYRPGRLAPVSLPRGDGQVRWLQRKQSSGPIQCLSLRFLFESPAQPITSMLVTTPQTG